jgi:hypothetical protein
MMVGPALSDRALETRAPQGGEDAVVEKLDQILAELRRLNDKA